MARRNRHDEPAYRAQSETGHLPVPVAEERYSDLLVQAREDIGAFLERRLGARLMPKLESRGWDAAVWVDALRSPTFNPVLVMYASRVEQKDDLRDSLHDLRLPLALFIIDHAEPDWDVAEDYVIVTVGVDKLAQLNKRQFTRLLVKARDRLVHSQS
ncbi:hypothetical protein GCM10029978_045500 [Actinoallomurus acanthiterrae]